VEAYNQFSGLKTGSIYDCLYRQKDGLHQLLKFTLGNLDELVSRFLRFMDSVSHFHLSIIDNAHDATARLLKNPPFENYG